MKKALITATVYGFVGSFEKNNIHLLQSLGYEVTVAVNKNIMNRGELRDESINIVDIPFARSPFDPVNKKAYQMLLALIMRENFDLIHTHTPVAGVLTRKAVNEAVKKGCRRPRVIYTAHGFHFYNGAPLKNNIIYYSIEKSMAKLTDIIITINHEDYLTAHEKFKPRKEVRYVPGVGIDNAAIREAVKKVSREELRRIYSVPEDAFLIISTGELNQNKNHALVIKALGHIAKNDVNWEEKETNITKTSDIKKIYYMIIGEGLEKENLSDLAKSEGISDRVIMPGYIRKPYTLAAAADLFVFPSKREGLPVSMLEAMSAGMPALASAIRGNRDLMQRAKLAPKTFFSPIFKPDDSEELAAKIAFLASETDAAKNALSILSKENVGRAMDFDKEKVIARMKEIYKD